MSRSFSKFYVFDISDWYQAWQVLRWWLMGSTVMFSLPVSFLYLYNSNWYGGQYQNIQTAQGSWYQWKWYCPTGAGGEGDISFTTRTRTQGQYVYPDIALHISNYCVYCIEDQNLTHNINAQKLFKESRNLIGNAIYMLILTGSTSLYTVFGRSISASHSVSRNSETN